MRLSFLESIHSDMSRIEDIVISRYNHREARLALDEVSRLQERALARTHISVISRSISEALNELHYALFPQNAGGNCEVPCDLDNNLFANFFGFSLGIGLPSGKKGIALPLSRKRATDVVNNISANCVFDSESDDQALDLIDAIWPVATDLNPYLIYGKAEQPRNFEPPRTTREFTISRLNRSRALYITSLGAIREIEQKGIYFPLAYLMISPHRATWQIGRIIDRIHTLGIFRLASFIEYDKIEDANNGMRMLIDRANKNADMDIQTLSGEFAKLGADIGNGLHYRIEWSRFYARLYHESIEMLTFERVEGYQTYKEFVVRKLSERFETIDGIKFFMCGRYQFPPIGFKGVMTPSGQPPGPQGVGSIA